MIPKFVITIEARMLSKRLPGKVLTNLGNEESSLSLILKRLKLFNLNYDTIVITSKKKANDAIQNLSKKLDVKCFRGSEENVLKRLYLSTASHKADTIIQLTADNPFVDMGLMKYMIKKYIKLYPDIDFLTNNNLFSKTSSSPLGLNISIIKKSSLKKIYLKAKLKDLKEHPTLYFYREGRYLFKIKNIKVPLRWRIKCQPRLTLDTKKDLQLIRKLFLLLKYKNDFSFSDLKKIFKKYPTLLNINKDIKQKIPKRLIN